mmetsp:Transcript_43427/g.102962  ORF Transcript_43427/g.102962 Transcript_43427/m.102962 type:complete len:238 (+) Transcript_43427:803-1516(+)
MEQPDHLVDGISVEEEVRVVVPDGVQAEQNIVLRQLAAAVLLGEGLPRALLRFDVLLHLVPGAVPRNDLRGRRRHERIGEQREAPLLLQEAVDGPQRADALELEEALNLRVLGVLEHVDELPIIRPHLVGVHDLVPPADFKRVLEKLGVVAEGAVLDELLPLLVVLRHHEARQDGADVLDLRVHAGRLAPPRQDVDLVGVLADAEAGLKEAEQAALLHVEPQGDVLAALHHVRVRGG